MIIWYKYLLQNDLDFLSNHFYALYDLKVKIIYLE